MDKSVTEGLAALHKKIGHNVKMRREEVGLSQLRLAEEIGQKSTTIISQAELGKNKHFNIEQLYKIAQVLECDICQFFED